MLNFLSILNLIIAVQATFLSLHFLSKKRGERRLNFLVALLNFIFGIITFNTYLNLNQTYNQLFQDIANNLMWFIGPAIYLFISYHKYPVTQKRLIWHTVPFSLLAVMGLIIQIPLYQSIIPIIGLTQMLTYLILSISHGIKNYQKSRSFFHWILPVVISFLLLVLINFSLRLLETTGIKIWSDAVLQSFTSILAIPIFLIAYKEMNSTNDFGFLQKKYKTSKLSEETIRSYLNQINAAFSDDKLFLDPNLTLSKVSARLNIQSKYISQVINQELNMSFSDFVLQFRIEQVKKDLINPQKAHLTINGIAQEAGFASSSRFNQQFKKAEGITPGQFQKQQLS